MTHCYFPVAVGACRACPGPYPQLRLIVTAFLLLLATALGGGT
jgi:hypothetical protein